MRALIVQVPFEADILVCSEGLSFWGGVDPETGRIIDAHHPQHGQSLAGKAVMMPTSRGSCSGSGVLLELAMNRLAPAALIFREDEDILTLGAVLATEMFDHAVAVLRLPPADYDRLARQPRATLCGTRLMAGTVSMSLPLLSDAELDLTTEERAMLEGAQGPAVQLAMQTLCKMAVVQRATRLIPVSRGHIDGCIYAAPAYLSFARKMADMGARVAIPTTTNAISVDFDNWQAQGVPSFFGHPASQLAQTYVDMGVQDNFTCAPYQADNRPAEGEDIGWSESNAVIYANSVLGARSAKHPDFLDLFIALTGRAPQSGVYLEENRVAQVVISVDLPEHYDDALWPMLGWLAGQAAPDRIPLLTGLENTTPSADDLRALCAAFGTTSAAPMLHVAGITPEANLPPDPDAAHILLTRDDLVRSWQAFNQGPATIDLVALGSPHFSLEETRAFAHLMQSRTRHPKTGIIITLGRDTKSTAKAEGLISQLESAGVTIVSDLCWCSISEPVLPRAAKTLMTNSGKYAHYAPGLSGRAVRFGSLADCARAAETGHAEDTLPGWLSA
ncbi:aconitase X [Alisedimentitalea sp. MJ-SS2]|uniref:cis-3-hydroxy-L-proline dehydratase n=1 Tax=Aliisedimentitalea sp. MJ-SS2 TaxID=3049795 RepID=UPI00290D4116|nr:aconitase X [Alisedimentitalea sp. MJ-SS2]MDU8929472.1 aconitase X [Alisedimentitalea sp. MJ-SS2]